MRLSILSTLSTDFTYPTRYFKSKEIEVPLTGLTYMLPDATPNDGLWMIDTAELFSALEGESGNDKRSLERVCRLLQIPVEWLHNAGNDAHVCRIFFSVSFINI